MHPISFTLLALAATSHVSALNLWPRADSCPPVWKEVVKELKSELAGCGVLARSSVRAVLHDCLINGCDGSLVTTNECSRAENAGLQPACANVKSVSQKYKVSAADTIQVAGAIGLVSCSMGPRVPALVGRKDSYIAAPEGRLPRSRDSVNKILAPFAEKGFSPRDVIALLGTHTTAVQIFDDPSKAGTPLDSTPGIYDNLFYKETKHRTAPYSLQSDLQLSNSSHTEPYWSEFADGRDKWLEAFKDAWSRFSVIGNDVSKLKDCSSLIPESSASRKRMEANARFAEKLGAKFKV